MNKNQTCTVGCSSLTPHDANYIYSGAICDEGALVLSQALTDCFDYYKYDRVSLQLESTGGTASSLDMLLRIFSKWRRSGKKISIRTDFQCASAAALLLSMSHWGDRRVDQGAMLLYHFTRIGGSVANLTATQAENMAHSMDALDQHMLTRLLFELKESSGGARGLLNTIRKRMDCLDEHWNWVKSRMQPSSFVKASPRKPTWHKAARAICKDGTKPDSAIALYEKHMLNRFKQDSPMDVREAYVFCLIDQIDDVIGPNGVLLDSLDDSYSNPATQANENMEQRPAASRHMRVQP